MQRLKEKINYIVLPKEVLKKTQKTLPSLRALRTAVSQSWRGPGAVEEIRIQRKK